MILLRDQSAGQRRRAVIRAALEAMRGVGVQSVALALSCGRSTGSNHADSIRMFLVFSVIMVSKPPMTPASATGFFASAMIRSSGDELAVNAVESLERFAITRAADDDLAAFEQVEIERVRGMAHLPQRVIGWRRRRC